MPTALVTGASGAIGLALSEGLASAGFEVVLACRDRARGEHACARVREHAVAAPPRLELIDLSLSSSVCTLGERFTGPLDVLVNNAADTPRRREVTAEGIERQLATNVLAYLWTVQALETALCRAGSARVVNVASYWAGGLDLSDLEFERRPYDNDAAYRQSKQANRMLTVAQAEALASHGIVVNACHPGDVPSRLASSLGFGGHQSPEEGAETPLWLATGQDGANASGKYFEARQERACSFASDRAAVRALWERCLAYGP